MEPGEPIDELMLRWEAARQVGTDLSPEQVCADCPELTDDLRRRIRAVVAMENILGVTEHSAQGAMLDLGDAALDDSEAELFPHIPGYDIIRIIDQGGMGVVFEARQIKLGRTVAIKMISGVRLRPKSKARFHAEAEAAARLQHPNFVQIFEVGEINGRPFFSMEYVAGGSLAQLLTRDPPPARRAAELVETLARAVHAAHERGIVHRDLKPGNVMLTADGIPKIADFGLAKRLDDDSSHTHTGEILGTPSYMAPEQAEGKKDQIGPHTDVYALGAILYELLTGKPPFQGATPLDSLRQVVSREPTAPSQLKASVARDLEAICLKCLEKAPKDRYASAQALADDLRRFLDGQAVTARRIGPVGRAVKWMRRHPQAVALALVLLALAPVLYVAVELYNQHQLHLKVEEQKRRIRQTAEDNAPLVREILKRNCFECHGQDPKNVQKDLHILNHQELLDSARRIVVPGFPEKSRLIVRIEDGSMPPEEKELTLPRLTDREITILKAWILGGAPPMPTADAEHPKFSAEPYSELAAKAKKIFANHCYECHRFDVAKGGVKILHHRHLVSVRRVVVPGHPEESELYKALTSPDEKTRMPPIEDGDFLSKEEIETIRLWISEGAPPFPKGK